MYYSRDLSEFIRINNIYNCTDLSAYNCTDLSAYIYCDG